VSFAGWALADLAILFGSGAVAVTGLYLLRMRRRKVEVPFAALWDRVTRESETRRLWKRLRRLLSWLIQLIVLALACLALGDPRPESWLRDPRTVAIVIDTSASMAGSTEEGPTRLETALTRVRAEIGALGPADRAVLIAAGSEVTVPAPLGGDPTRLLAALEGLQPTPGEADMTRALALARNVVAGQRDPDILILTDGALGSQSLARVGDCLNAGSDPEAGTGETGSEGAAAQARPRCRLMLIEGPTANVAITAFAARRYPSDREKVEVLVEVQNLGDEPATFLVDVEAEGLSVGDRKRVELAPGERRRLIEPKLDAARDRLIARLEPVQGDPASAASLGPKDDDVAWAIVPPLDPLEAVLVTDGSNLFLEAALLTLDDHVRLTTLPPDQGQADHEAIRDADLVFYDVADHPLPDPLPETNLVLFDPHRKAESPSPIELRSQLQRPRLSEQARKHEILAGVVFKDVNMHRGTSFKTRPGDQVLVSHLGEPVVVLREDLDSILAIGFDPRESDLPLRVAFPLLVANTVDYFARREAGFVASVPVGASRELALADLGLGGRGVHAVEIREPSPARLAEQRGTMAPARDTVPSRKSRTRASVQNGRFRIRALVPGFHVLEALGGESAGAQVEIAVNQASADASNLNSRIDASGLSESQLAGGPPAPAPLNEGPLWTLILLAIAAVIALEWASYHRRKTV
jgi:hypothetical protein